MSVLAFVFAVVFALVLLFIAVAAARRGSATRGDGSFAVYSDGGSPHSDSGAGADCGSSDGGGGCDGGGGGD